MTEDCFEYISESDRDTVGLGRKLGRHLTHGDVVALMGNLGCGKTWFTKGLAAGVGVDPAVVITSPSFALVNEYHGRCAFYHMDLYRLEDPSDVLSAGLAEYFYEDGIVAIEWADKWPGLIPDCKVDVKISILGERRRRITLSGSHPRLKSLIRAVEKEVREGLIF